MSSTAALPDVWTLEIWHRHGNDITVHVSEADAKAMLLSYVEEWWQREIPDSETRPPTPDQLIELYFAFVGREGYEIRKTSLYGAKAVELADA